MTNKTAINVNEVEEVGDIEQLSPERKAQFWMSYFVLGMVFLTLAASAALYVFADGGLHEYYADIISLCTNNGTSVGSAAEFCKKYLAQTSSSRNIGAKEFFEFCKNFLPPIVTLVLGAHYVNYNNGASK